MCVLKKPSPVSGIQAFSEMSRWTIKRGAKSIEEGRTPAEQQSFWTSKAPVVHHGTLDEAVASWQQFSMIASAAALAFSGIIAMDRFLVAALRQLAGIPITDSFSNEHSRASQHDETCVVQAPAGSWRSSCTATCRRPRSGYPNPPGPTTTSAFAPSHTTLDTVQNQTHRASSSRVAATSQPPPSICDL